jgi:hypothetical protein
MKNLVKWIGITAIAVIIGLSFAACEDGGDDNGGGIDTWSNVTSISQINGTWKAPSSVTYNTQGMTVIARYSNYTVTFNAAAKTQTASGSCTITYSGGDIAAQWPSLKESLQSIQLEDGLTLTFNDANYSYTMTLNNSTTPAPEDFTGLQINQNGKKLKFVNSEDLYIEIIYTKQ